MLALDKKRSEKFWRPVLALLIDKLNQKVGQDNNNNNEN